MLFVPVAYRLQMYNVFRRSSWSPLGVTLVQIAQFSRGQRHGFPFDMPGDSCNKIHVVPCGLLRTCICELLGENGVSDRGRVVRTY